MGVWSTLNSTVLPETPAQLAARRTLEEETRHRIASLKTEQQTLTEEKAALTKQLAALGNPTAPAPQAGATDNAQREIAPAETAKPAVDKGALTKRRDALETQKVCDAVLASAQSHQWAKVS
jgi:hypothetical protein